jgi:hypothetical protein
MPRVGLDAAAKLRWGAIQPKSLISHNATDVRTDANPTRALWLRSSLQLARNVRGRTGRLCLRDLNVRLERTMGGQGSTDAEEHCNVGDLAGTTPELMTRWQPRRSAIGIRARTVRVTCACRICPTRAFWNLMKQGGRSRFMARWATLRLAVPRCPDWGNVRCRLADARSPPIRIRQHGTCKEQPTLDVVRRWASASSPSIAYAAAERQPKESPMLVEYILGGT